MRTLYLNLPLPSWERIEVRGNDPITSIHPHPNPVRQAHDTALPSREREIMEGD
jgi:hypothetical protein